MCVEGGKTEEIKHKMLKTSVSCTSNSNEISLLNNFELAVCLELLPQFDIVKRQRTYLHRNLDFQVKLHLITHSELK